ncbi:hypothetical protein B4100_0988 [Heyndrickxia coagulans]|nr:hypothetical protein B4100_0988 [Heyndrickxia coagulans]
MLFGRRCLPCFSGAALSNGATARNGDYYIFPVRMCKILLEGANEWKKMGRHSII